ncbi:MAG TPA: response regulator [Cryomorphaceae bacterium]|nr:response regulator [Owenweeksia sp.]MBF97933.1 response regulator [Owenweeksia sp.]HAD98028.1 response regulator [Cryomorphaceae bacterium]HBF20895.1 response regulator [Cryomorphaceae bacterium]|tara:strand:- start:5966 stop:7129 length:1164 start_codon:yes stop_codon:yes gene_type:complete
MAKILIVEDEKAIRNVLRNILKDENKDFEIEEAENGKQALDLMSEKEFDLALCDIKMPGMDGIEVLEQVREKHPDTAVVMISGHGDLDTAVESMRKGAYDYISKPPDLNRLINTVRNALDRNTLVRENKVLKKKVGRNFQMIGDSPALEQIKEMIEKVAPTEARVLITGPNGTGKELVAHWIHQKSERNKAPMVEVNCAAIPSELIESELFGHKKGAFTSAVKDRKGKFEQANEGTLFLDEIGDMSLSAQAKVLRALQEGKITPVGGDKEIKVNVRVLAATNKNLQEEIKEGKFREDLYHRLSVILIKVPPLNDRKEDIPVLTEYFAQKIAEEQGMSLKKFNDSALKELQKIDWTGNIRELRNVVERLIILGGSEISASDVQTFASK